MPSVIYMPPYVVRDDQPEVGPQGSGLLEETSSDYAAAPHHFMFYMIFFINCCTTVLGFLGNSLLVLTYSRESSLRTTTNTYLLSIAVTDLLVSLTCAVMPIAQDVVGSWPFEQISCKLSQAVMEFSTFATVLTLTAISIERYYAVMYPIERYISTRNSAVVVTSVIWLVSFLFSVPKFVQSGVRRHRLEGTRGHTTVSYCVIHRDRTEFARYMALVDFLMFYTVPLGIVCVVYLAVCRHLMKVNDDIATNTRMSAAHVYQARLRYRVAKLVIVLTAIFFVGFMPHNVLILKIFFHGITDAYWNSAASYAYCYGCLHFWLNPIAMYLCSDTVRKHFNHYLCCGRAPPPSRRTPSADHAMVQVATVYENHWAQTLRNESRLQ